MAIGYNRLGSNGRLGNQMFQYAGLRGIAAHKGYDWVIPPFNGYGDSNYGLFDCFKMSSVKEENFGYIQGQSIQSGCFHFSQEFFDNCPDNINLHDYFTTEKYFKNIEDLIRNDFEFKDEILNPCKEVFDDLKNPIFLHVRRSDYIGSQVHHPLCSLQYYENALKHFDEVKLYYNKGQTFTGNIQNDYYKHIKDSKPNLEHFFYINKGLWDCKTDLKFYKQSNENYVSQSLIENMFSNNYDIVEVDSIKNIMKEHNHTKIDLLKLDIEGAEIKVLDQMFNDHIYPTYLLIEFDLLLKGKDKENSTSKLIERILTTEHYSLLVNDNFNITFVRTI
jgi:FkbM family methyltransferase